VTAVTRQILALGVFYWSIDLRVNVAWFFFGIDKTRVGCREAILGVETRLLQALARSIQAGTMADIVMLVCAAIGSMAFGILAAYGILRAGFALLRQQPRPKPVKAQQAVVNEQ
jgi:hypothetical protein